MASSPREGLGSPRLVVRLLRMPSQKDRARLAARAFDIPGPPVPMYTRGQLAALAQAYAAYGGLGRSTLGMRACGNDKIFIAWLPAATATPAPSSRPANGSIRIGRLTCPGRKACRDRMGSCNWARPRRRHRRLLRTRYQLRPLPGRHLRLLRDQPSPSARGRARARSHDREERILSIAG